MPELKEILNLIEDLRTRLNKLAETKSLDDPEVISASQMLDAVLNEYQRIVNNKVNRS